MPEDRDPHSYEEANRFRKVLKLLTLFRVTRFGIKRVKALNNDGWKIAAMCAGYAEISDITKSLVVVAMEDEIKIRKAMVNATAARAILGRIKDGIKP